MSWNLKSCTAKDKDTRPLCMSIVLTYQKSKVTTEQGVVPGFGVVGLLGSIVQNSVI